MYSSGGDLHLELPTGEKEAHKNLWVSVVTDASISRLIMTSHSYVNQ